MTQIFIPLAWPNGSRYNKTSMKNHFRLWVGVVYFLVFIGPNVLAQNQSAEDSVFDPIKDQIVSIAEKNAALVKQNKTLQVQLIGLQLEVERHEKVIRDLDPGFTNKARLAREQNQASSTQSSHHLEGLDDAALIEEAQEFFFGWTIYEP